MPQVSITGINARLLELAWQRNEAFDRCALMAERIALLEEELKPLKEAAKQTPATEVPPPV